MRRAKSKANESVPKPTRYRLCARELFHFRGWRRRLYFTFDAGRAGNAAGFHKKEHSGAVGTVWRSVARRRNEGPRQSGGKETQGAGAAGTVCGATPHRRGGPVSAPRRRQTVFLQAL